MIKAGSPSERILFRSFFSPVFPLLPLPCVFFPRSTTLLSVGIPLFCCKSNSFIRQRVHLMRPSRRQFCQSVCRFHPVPSFRPVRIPREFGQRKLLNHE